MAARRRIALVSGPAEQAHTFTTRRARLLKTGTIRMLMGAVTRLPMPLGFVETPGDWPPPSPSCKGFVLNPSGHVLQATCVSLHLWRYGNTTAAAVLVKKRGSQRKEKGGK